LDPDAVWDGVWGRLRMDVLHGGCDRRRERDSFGGGFGASRTLVATWELRCVVVRERRALPKLLRGGVVLVHCLCERF